MDPWARPAEAEGIQPLEGKARLVHFQPAPAFLKGRMDPWARPAEAEGIQPLEGRACLVHFQPAPAFLKGRTEPWVAPAEAERIQLAEQGWIKSGPVTGTIGPQGLCLWESAQQPAGFRAEVEGASPSKAHLFPM